VVQFAQAFFAAAWIKHFGEVIDAQDVVKIEGAPELYAIRQSAPNAEARSSRTTGSGIRPHPLPASSKACLAPRSASRQVVERVAQAAVGRGHMLDAPSATHDVSG
jgi:hypothetical protein